MTEHENLISVPPDGGWAWVILCVSFYSTLVIDVPSFGFQIVEDDLMDLLSLPATEVSVFFSTYTMCMFLMGPVAGGVCNRFGFRLTNIIGCLLMIIGLGSSFFVSGYLEFLFLYGMAAGCGTSFILVVANVAIGFWFESKRSIAFGLVTSANGASVFSLFLSTYINDEYGWRYCFVVWAGMVCILLVASFLLASPPMVELEVAESSSTLDMSRVTTIIPLDYNNVVGRLSAKKLHKMSMATGIPIGRVGRPSIAPEPGPTGCCRLFGCCCCCDDCCQRTIGSRPLYRKDIFYHGSIHYAAKLEKQDGATFPLTMTELPTTRDVEQELECTCAIPEAVTRAMSQMLDCSLLCSPYFLLLLLSSVSVFTVRYIPFLVLKKYNLNYMDRETAADVVMMMGLGTLVLRAIIGFVMYFCSEVSALGTTIVVLILGGIALCCLTVSHEVLYQMILCFLAGAFTSLFIPLRSLIIIELLGLDKLTSCTGLLFFFQGFASFLGMPIATILKAKTGSHRLSIIFSGCGYLMAGFFNVIIACVRMGKRRN